jgi:hypothetical protein
MLVGIQKHRRLGVRGTSVYNIKQLKEKSHMVSAIKYRGISTSNIHFAIV